jgi:hypothetical protein
MALAVATNRSELIGVDVLQRQGHGGGRRRCAVRRAGDSGAGAGQSGDERTRRVRLRYGPLITAAVGRGGAGAGGRRVGG